MAKGRKTGGRTRGTPNRTTTVLKDAILRAAEEAHEGGSVGYLTWLAKEHPAPFATLLGKVLPLQITGADGGPVATVTTIELVAPDLPDESEG